MRPYSSSEEALETAVWRLFCRAEMGAPDECWPCDAFPSERSMCLTVQNVKRAVGRIIAAYFHGLDLADKTQLACHKCDRPECVNPDHIYVGDARTNMRDMVARGRHVYQKNPELIIRGIRHGSAKLTEAQVKEIRSAYDRGEQRTEIARRFGIAASGVWRIGQRKGWRHVP